MKTNAYLTPILALAAIMFGFGPDAKGQTVVNDDTNISYGSIQAAIDAEATLDGHTLLVGPGTYYENVLVDKELTIYGPKAGIPGDHPSRGSGAGEAVIMPPVVLYGDGTYNGGYLMRVTADHVTIDGLTFDGDNPDLEGGYSANTGAWDIDFGIMSYFSPWYDDPVHAADIIGDDLTVTNNILVNMRFCGMLLWGSPYFSHEDPVYSRAEAHAVVENNLFSNAGAIHSAVFASTNFYVDFTDNTVEDCRYGVVAYWYFNPDPLGTGGVISNNSFSLRTVSTNTGEVYTDATGINCTFIYDAADRWAIEDNVVHNISNAGNESIGIAITIDAMGADPLLIGDNDISNFEYGYRLSMNWFGTTITGGTLNHNRYGVAVSNWNFNGNFAASFADFTINGMDILNSMEAGVYIEDHETALPPDVSDPYFWARVNNCTIDGSPYGVLVDHPDGNAFVHETDLSGNDVAIANFSPQTVDATCNWYGHWTGPDQPPPSAGQGQGVEGLVEFDPWLTDGTDVQPATMGFQPDPATCVAIICGPKGNKFLLCHNGSTKCVGYEDAIVHLAHGDPLGACPEESYAYDPDGPFDGIVDAGRQDVTSWPNPFDDQVTIQYTVPTAGQAVLQVVNVLGQEVFAVDPRNADAGPYSQQIETAGWAPGLYVYRLILQSDGGTTEITGKLLKN